MKNYVLFDPSYGTFNMGDFIINDSAMKELKDILDNKFVVRVGTHNPVVHFYQLNKKRRTSEYFNNADRKFLLGTNIIKKNMLYPWPDWNVNIFNCQYYKNTILVGAGCDGNFSKVNYYTKKLYDKILSKDIVHSVRDEKTKKFLESLGFKAINTGCPTMWSLTSDFCKKIKKEKSDNVIFTLTDYRKDTENDQLLLNILLDNYKNVFFWVQGSGDYKYLTSLTNHEKVKIINPNIEDYRNFLKNTEADYIGTRLHAGIFAIKHMKRSLIIIVDNRANDINRTYNLPVISRNEINENLERIIRSDYETKIKIDVEKIKEWKGQFYNE